jgi:hypothetical protein
MPRLGKQGKKFDNNICKMSLLPLLLWYYMTTDMAFLLVLGSKAQDEEQPQLPDQFHFSFMVENFSCVLF